MSGRAALRRTGRHALATLAVLLMASGAIRIGLGLDAARALIPATATAAQGSDAMCSPGPELLVAALAAREARVAAREGAIADRLAALALAEAAARAEIARLEAAEAALAETLSRADGAAEADLDRLTAVYETMKPKDAAALFEAMDAEFAAGFLGRMRPDAAAAVMAGLTPETAYRISLLLAARNTRVPRE
jgi:flagellar motility protein MotE (MotC chaperone)